MTMFRPVTAAAVAVFACLSTAAVAQDAAHDRVTARIVHADLDLGTAEGRAALKTRIDRAVRRACLFSRHGGISAMRDTLRCRDEMLRDADVQVAAIPPRTVKLATRR